MKQFFSWLLKKALNGIATGFFIMLTIGGIMYVFAYTWSDQSGIRDMTVGNSLTASGWNLLVKNVDNLNDRTINAETIINASQWVNIPLSDTADYNLNCEYRFFETLQHDVNEAWMNSLTTVSRGSALSPKYLSTVLAGNYLFGVPSNDKGHYGARDTNGVFTVSPNVTVTKMEKRCN